MTEPAEPHPLVAAVRPLLDRVGATLLAPDERGAADLPLLWEGEVVAVVRFRADEPVGDLGLLLDGVAEELGSALDTLSRADKQRAVRLLEERGAFSYRKSAETIAEALGVTRFTVYNYLNRQR